MAHKNDREQTVCQQPLRLNHATARPKKKHLRKKRLRYNHLKDDVQYPRSLQTPILVFRRPIDAKPRISTAVTEVLTQFGIYTILNQLFFEQIRMHILRQPFTDFR